MMIESLFTLWLSVVPPVASLQLDLTTATAPVLASAITSKQVAVNQITPGQYRVIVYGMNAATFSGHFLTTSASVTAIGNLTCASATGMAVPCTVTMASISSPANLRRQ